MIYHNVADIFEMIKRAQASFAASVADLSEAQENFRPESDRWTIAENAEHVSTVSHLFVKLIGRQLTQAEADPQPPPVDLELPPLTFTSDGQPVGKAPAPDRVRPQGGVPVTESLAKNQQAFDAISALIPRLEAVDLSKQILEQVFLGPLNTYQWLLLMGEHQNRHRLQIDAIKAAPGFPH